MPRLVTQVSAGQVPHTPAVLLGPEEGQGAATRLPASPQEVQLLGDKQLQAMLSMLQARLPRTLGPASRERRAVSCELRAGAGAGCTRSSCA